MWKYAVLSSLGHYQGGSLNNLMLIFAYRYLFNVKVSGSTYKAVIVIIAIRDFRGSLEIPPERAWSRALKKLVLLFTQQ